MVNEYLPIGKTKQILDRLPEWKKGITPSGKLAKESCFVQRYMPPILPLTHDHSTALLVTHSVWTQRLVEQRVLWDTNNDSTMHSLAKAQLLFYPQQHAQHPITFAKKTLHMLFFESAAMFATNNILRCTRPFQQAIEAALATYPADFRLTLQNLMQVFDTFGFLWPQKIILGHRHHSKSSYKVYTPEDRLMYLRRAKDDVLMKITSERASLKHTPLDGDDESVTWSIIKRNDVCPIYELLDKPWRQQIEHVIHECLYRIPIHAPIKLRNHATQAYLSWQSHQKDGFVLAARPMEHMAGQYLWQFTWTYTKPILPDVTASYTPAFIRCGSDVYISPYNTTDRDNDNTPPDSQNSTTHTTILTRSLEGDARIRSIVLLPTPDDCPTEMTWKVELPGLGLGRDDDSSTDEGLNMDILIGRCRPVLHSDIIALRQVLYLCALPSKSSTSSPIAAMKQQQQKPFQKKSISSYPIVAKENALIANLEQCWYVELASEDDLRYHQQAYAPWLSSPSSASPLLTPQQQTLRTTRSDESLHITTPSNRLRRVRSFHHSADEATSRFVPYIPPSAIPSATSPSYLRDGDNDDDQQHDELGFDTTTDPRAEPYLRLVKPSNALTQVWKRSSLKQVFSRFYHPPGSKHP